MCVSVWKTGTHDGRNSLHLTLNHRSEITEHPNYNTYVSRERDRQAERERMGFQRGNLVLTHTHTILNDSACGLLLETPVCRNFLSTPNLLQIGDP